MNNHQTRSIHFWQSAPLPAVELLSARYIQQRFAPHVHDGYVIGMIMANARATGIATPSIWQAAARWC